MLQQAIEREPELLTLSTMRQVLMLRDEEGTWVVECPSLPGCISQGQTKEEALRNTQEAIRAYVAALEEDHLLVPEERFDAMNELESTRCTP